MSDLALKLEKCASHELTEEAAQGVMFSWVLLGFIAAVIPLI